MLGVVPYWATKNNSQRLMVEHIEGRMDDISKAARLMVCCLCFLFMFFVFSLKMAHK